MPERYNKSAQGSLRFCRHGRPKRDLSLHAYGLRSSTGRATRTAGVNDLDPIALLSGLIVANGSIGSRHLHLKP